MKLSPSLKRILLSTLFLLWISGTITWIFGQWFLVQSPFGAGMSPLRFWWLQVHAIVSLWFFILFGYLFHAHVQPSWRRGKKRRSGGLLTGSIIFLLATVPGLYYIANENLKNKVVWAHTYVGLAALAVFIYHLRDRRKTGGRR